VESQARPAQPVAEPAEHGAGEPVAAEPVVGDPVAGDPVAGDPVARPAQPVARHAQHGAGEPVAGDPVARPALDGAGESVAGKPVAGAAQPVALLYGRGHKVVHANPAFVAEFGAVPIGVPAAEALLDLPPIVLEIVERVIAEARPLAAWVTVRGARRRLTVAPRADPETGEVYGVALRLARE
jgi:hypothetical protein